MKNVNHYKIADNARAFAEDPDTWVHVKQYPNHNTARVMACLIRRGRMRAYPEGEFQARIFDGTAVYVRQTPYD